jgi:metal-responsive CopG/Arc/MetJ family transcriptional regulator
LLSQVDRLARELRIPRTEYIRRALADFNQEIEDQKNRKRLMRASMKVRENSMTVNAEFDEVEDAPAN